MKKPYISKVASYALFAAMALFSFNCEREPQNWEPKSDELQIREYVGANDSIYSEFTKAMDISKMSSLLSTRGPFTVFLPDDDAMFNFYKKHGKNTVEDFDPEYLKKLVLNHMVPQRIFTSAMGLGSIGAPNGLEDYLVSEFIESDIYINKDNRIVKRDIVTANGVVHRLDKVIDIVTLPIYDILDLEKDFSIFFQGLEKSGLADTMRINEVPYGKDSTRVRMTIFAVPDSIYAKHNIFNVDDLIKKYDDGVGELHDLDNGFFKYMDYHCLEGALYTNVLESASYPTISRENLVSFVIDDEYKINYDKVTDEYDGIIVQGSNIPVKNGVVHAVDGLMEAVQAKPAPYTFEVTDFPDVKSQDSYMKYIRNYFDGQNTYAKIKWQADYLQYYFKTTENYKNNDCLTMSDGFWTLDITLPRIKRGKYKIYGQFKSGNNRANVIFYIDGVKTDGILELNDNNFQIKEHFITDIVWEKTEEHLFRVKSISPGIMMFDYLRFVPIEK
jgi:uncharacterized surface protein with fasciclin (FAS1) repeats